MPKYCKNYKIICTCMTCLNVECGFSSKTRAEAEVMRGVKLDKQGNEIGAGSAPATIAVEPDPVSSGSSRPYNPPVPARALGRDGLWVAFAAVAIALLVGLGAIVYIFVNVIGRDEGTEVHTPDPELAALAADQKVLVLEPEDQPAQAQPDVPVVEAPPPAPPEEKPAELREVAAVAPQPRAPREPRPAHKVDPEVLRQLDQLREEGNKLVQDRQFTKAREFYRQAISVNPSYYQGYNNLANTYSDDGSPAEAEPIYRQGLRIEPHSTHLHYNLGVNYYRQGKLDEAFKEMLWVIEANPEDVDAYMLAGVILHRMSDLANAARFFHAAAAADSQRADAYFNLYVVYLALGQRGVANSYLAQARNLDPSLVNQQLARAGG